MTCVSLLTVHRGLGKLRKYGTRVRVILPHARAHRHGWRDWLRAKHRTKLATQRRTERKLKAAINRRKNFFPQQGVA